MPVYAGFNPESIKIIIDALQFTGRKILEYYENLLKNMDRVHHPSIKKAERRELDRLNSLIKFFSEHPEGGIFVMNEKSHAIMMDVIRSALEVYLRDLIKISSEISMDDFNEKVREINRITSLESLKNAKANLYDKYYPPMISSEGRKVEFFICYSSKDKELAGKIRDLLVNRKGVDVFLAHHDISISKEWRDEIHRHLESCTVLLALLTPNFENSVWANQEAGFALGKRKKVIPLIVEGSDIKKFGFLEEKQGVVIKEDNLMHVVDKILKISLSK